MPIKIRFKIWLEKDGCVLFGHGRWELLKAIEEYESLNAAAKKLNMSYRAAWGRLKASEDRLGFRLVEHMQGKRMHLTPRGHALLERFDRLEKDISRQLKDISKELNDVAAKNPAALKEGKKT